MAPAKGTRTGGRQKATLNKKTIQRMNEADIEKRAQELANEIEAGRKKQKKLGKDVLESFVDSFSGLAAYYQNKIATALKANGVPDPKDLDGFERWGGLAATHSNNLANFQSPKFKAIAVMLPPPQNPAAMKTVKEIENLDPQSASRTYLDVVKAAAPPAPRKASAA